MAEHVITVPSQLGPVLRALRRQRGLTQKVFAERLGMSRQAVSEFERTPERASFERLHRACSALEVEVVLRPRESKGSRGTW